MCRSVAVVCHREGSCLRTARRARGIRRVRRVVPDIDDTAIEGQTRPVGEPVLELAVTGVALLVIKRLIPVGRHSVYVGQDCVLPSLTQQAGVDVERVQLGVERAIRERGADIRVRLQFRRLHVDGAAKVSRPEIGSLARAAVEIR